MNSRLGRIESRETHNSRRERRAASARMTFNTPDGDKSVKKKRKKSARRRIMRDDPRRVSRDIHEKLRKRAYYVPRVFHREPGERKHGISAPPFLRVSAFPTKKMR